MATAHLSSMGAVFRAWRGGNGDGNGLWWRWLRCGTFYRSVSVRRMDGEVPNHRPVSGSSMVDCFVKGKTGSRYRCGGPLRGEEWRR
jgi:hypothetical protein